MFGTKNKMLIIEINDTKINREVCRLVFHVEKNIILLKRILEGAEPGDRDAALEDLYKTFLRIHRDVDMLYRDIRQIVNNELQEKDYIRLNDKSYLNDKLVQIAKIKANIENIIPLIEDRPTDRELKQDLLNTMIVDVNNIIQAVNSIISDDKSLEKIYKELNKAPPQV
ncbi:hypothetical protein C4573_04305 [Candidatus Woesearchaeota archaeon]|nr:MAG: hypothetical protein C4573_04305 [Candidatus Woesearchaeota archaeon]